MATILYISYTGLAEPLGQSQVFQYLKALARDHDISLLTFERDAGLRDVKKMAALAEQCQSQGIKWIPLKYHRRPGIPATIYDIANGIRMGRRIAKQKRIDIIHARSYVPGMIALALKRHTGASFVFDMRGFWPDERVDGGIWKKNSYRYHIVKKIERSLFENADHVVSLTRAGAREIETFEYLQGRMPGISVIPTCTNLELFNVVRENGSHDGSVFTLGYVGSAGSWYMFSEVARAVRLLFDKNAGARFLVVNQNDHGYIRDVLKFEGVDLSRVEIVGSSYKDVARHIGRMSAGIFFIKPVFSKQASCPTRMGEFLACGVPVLANSGVGDVEEDLSETATGIAIDKFDDETISSALDQLIKLSNMPGMDRICRAAAVVRFSLETGVVRYDKIYRNLTSE